MIGAELMAQAIERQGVKTVFGLPGHLEPFFGALLDRHMRLIHMRHEAAVVTAADGYARMRRNIGVACVTAGPGLANALGGLATAFHACTPVLLFSGRNPFSVMDSGAIQEMDHPRAARSMTKWARTVHDPSRLAEYIDMACRIALSGRPGPVLLDVPRDVAVGQVDEEIATRSLGPLVRADKPVANSEAIHKAVDMLMEAEHPLIIAGSGAYWGHAGPGLQRLANEFRLPVMAKTSGRGLVPENLETGFSWALGHPATHQADVVMVVGSRMGSSIGFAAPPYFRDDARFIQIDIDGAEIGRNRPIEAPVVGDCGQAIEKIATELEHRRYKIRDSAWLKRGMQEKLDRIDEVGRSESGQVHPLRMARELAARLPDDAVFVGDGANCLNWYKAILRIKCPAGYLDQEPFGSMGVGLPLAIGAVAALQETGSERTVFLGTGDGAFGQYLGELATASLHGLPIFIMVANDGAWGASRNNTLKAFGGTYGVELNQSRYDLVAKGLECHGELATSPKEVGPAFDRALQSVRAGKTALVNVLVDRDSGKLRVKDPLLQMVPFNTEWIVVHKRKPVSAKD